MEIDKTLALAAPPGRVWALLLDPEAMAACVPGMESVQVISDTEYAAVMKVKISFVSARFKLHTRLVQLDPPRYLKAEGTGEDSSVASSLKQVSEMWLEPSADGGTALRLRVQVDVLGRIGSFGLAAMKTKADRLWDEFGVNLAARLSADAPTVEAPQPVIAPPHAIEPPTGTDGAGAPPAPAAAPDGPAWAGGIRITPPPGAQGWPASPRPGFWGRLFGAAPEPIRVELRHGANHLVVTFPVEAADACAGWLRSFTDPAR